MKKTVLSSNAELFRKVMEITGLPKDLPVRRVIIDWQYDGLTEITVEYLGFVEVDDPKGADNAHPLGQ